MLWDLLYDVSLQDKSIHENKRTRGTNTRQPQKRADGLRSYLEPSQSVRAHFVCAPESLVQTDSPECALRACTDGQLCVCSESCTDGQTTASRERAKALLGMATLPSLTLEVFVRERFWALETSKLPLSLIEVNFMKKTTKHLLGKKKKKKKCALGFSTNDLRVLWYHIFETDGTEIRVQFLDMHDVLPRFPSALSWCIT